LEYQRGTGTDVYKAVDGTMILFKPEHVPMILSGRKTETRRLGNKRWNVGAVHQARTRMMDKDSTFANLKIISIRQEYLDKINLFGVWREGYKCKADYKAAFYRINPKSEKNPLLWVVRFELMEDLTNDNR
jgi:hypothetical protein